MRNIKERTARTANRSSILAQKLLILGLLASTTLQKPCPENCLDCDSNGKCTTCMATYGLMFNACRKCEVEDCLDCSGNPNKCIECKPYLFYERALNECMNCPFGCSECENSGECLKCGAIYKFSDLDRADCQINFLTILAWWCLIVSPCVVFWIGVYILMRKKSAKIHFRQRELKRNDTMDYGTRKPVISIETEMD